MVPVPVAGNIPGEATTSSGNIFNDAMRGIQLRRKRENCSQPVTLRRLCSLGWNIRPVSDLGALGGC